MSERVAIIQGLRTPFCKAYGHFKHLPVDEIAAPVVRELIERSPISVHDIDEFIAGNVVEPIDGTNIARIIAYKAGLLPETPAFTVNRNCASGLQAIVSASLQIMTGFSKIVVAGGAEAMSQVPITFPPSMRNLLLRLSKQKKWLDRGKTLLSLRPSFFQPHIPEIRDPLCSLSMGQTAEKIARELLVSRKESDLFALESQKRAYKAEESGFFAEEIFPLPIFEKERTYFQKRDDGVRADQTLEALEKLPPAFEPITGTVTAGNSSQVTDGACFLILMSESEAKRRGITPLGFVTGFAEAGLDPSRMGLGPAFAMAKLFQKTGTGLKNYDLIEINEAFACQVVAIMKALNSPAFCQKELGLPSAMGEIDPSRLNIHGGACALGHPVGASGARLVLTLLHSLHKEKKERGLATLCIGGGQGQAISLEVA